MQTDDVARFRDDLTVEIRDDMLGWELPPFARASGKWEGPDG